MARFGQNEPHPYVTYGAETLAGAGRSN